MKKLLIGTTALVSALMVANVASAQTAPELKVGMDLRFWANMVDDDEVGAEDREFRVDYRMPIAITGKTDSGLTYGGYVRIRTSRAATFSAALPQPGGDNRSDLYVDYGFVHIGGAFGKLEFGENDGPMTITYVAAPTVGAMQINDAGNAFNGVIGVGNFRYGSALYLDQSTRINYYTPVFAGFQGAIGYAPEMGSRGLNVHRFADPATNPAGTASIQDAFEMAVVWTGKFDPATVKASVGYATGSASTVALNDLDVLQAGLNVGFGPWTVGGAYYNNKDSRSLLHDEEIGWNLGASWKQGALGVAASYGRTKTEYTAASGLAETEDTMYGIGANYLLAPGLHLDADLVFVDSESYTPALRPANSGNEGNVLTLRTRLLL